MKPTTSYTSEFGIIVKVYPYKKPRVEEKTWTASKYSIYNQGRQGMLLGRKGVRATCDNIQC